MIEHDEIFLELGFPALSDHMGTEVTYHYADGGIDTVTAVIGDEEEEAGSGQYHETRDNMLHVHFKRSELRSVLQAGDWMDYDSRKWAFVKITDRTTTVLTVQFKSMTFKQTGMRTKGL